MRQIRKILVDSASPDYCAAILLSIKKGGIILKEDLIEKVKMRTGYNKDSPFRPGPDSINRLTDLGIIKKINRNKLLITGFGNKCKDLLIEDRKLYNEFMHYLHISPAFDNNMDGYFLTYYLISKYLYENGKIGERQLFLSNVLADIEKLFGHTNVKSIDMSSISKVVSWLKILDPPFVMNNGTFIPRKNVKLPVITMAISSYYEHIKLPFGTPIMLDDKSIKDISQKGLIDEGYFLSNLSKASVFSSNLALTDTVDGKAILLRKRFELR